MKKKYYFGKYLFDLSHFKKDENNDFYVTVQTIAHRISTHIPMFKKINFFRNLIILIFEEKNRIWNISLWVLILMEIVCSTS